MAEWVGLQEDSLLYTIYHQNINMTILTNSKSASSSLILRRTVFLVITVKLDTNNMLGTHLFLFLAPGMGDGDRGLLLRDAPSGPLMHLRLVISTIQ